MRRGLVGVRTQAAGRAHVDASGAVVGQVYCVLGGVCEGACGAAVGSVAVVTAAGG
jgi:hypothetical protein